MAINEANFAVKAIKNYKIDLPIFFDIEYDSINYANKCGVTVDQRLATDMVKVLWEISIQGDEVKYLQEELTRQCGANLKGDGLFREDTLNACITIYPGASGNLTRLVQQRLRNRGYTSLLSCGGADSKWGAGTTRVIKNLQLIFD